MTHINAHNVLLSSPMSNPFQIQCTTNTPCFSPRSNGCNLLENQCLLADQYNYVNIAVSVTDADAQVTLSSPSNSFQGKLEFWKYDMTTDDGVDVYESAWVFLYINNQNVFNFQSLRTGQYVVVYWDKGGLNVTATVPMSDPFSI